MTMAIQREAAQQEEEDEEMANIRDAITMILHTSHRNSTAPISFYLIEEECRDLFNTNINEVAARLGYDNAGSLLRAMGYNVNSQQDVLISEVDVSADLQKIFEMVDAASAEDVQRAAKKDYNRIRNEQESAQFNNYRHQNQHSANHDYRNQNHHSANNPSRGRFYRSSTFDNSNQNLVAPIEVNEAQPVIEEDLPAIDDTQPPILRKKRFTYPRGGSPPQALPRNNQQDLVDTSFPVPLDEYGNPIPAHVLQNLPAPAIFQPQLPNEEYFPTLPEAIQHSRSARNDGIPDDLFYNEFGFEINPLYYATSDPTYKNRYIKDLRNRINKKRKEIEKEKEMKKKNPWLN